MNNIIPRRLRPMPPPVVAPFDVNEMEGELRDTVRTVAERRAPEPTPMPALPAYVEHAPNVDEIGRLSAGAIAGQYETAAKTIEAMGADLVRCVTGVEALASEAKEAIQHVEELAQRYREDAKRMFDQIERASLLTAEVRKTCDEMRRKLEPGA